MSLQVWLPFDGTIENQGLTTVTVTNNNATINNNGKIGKCYQFGTAASNMTLPASTMNDFQECTLSFWINILSWNTNYATYFQAGLGGTPWLHYIFGVLRNNANSNLCFTIASASSASNANFITPNLNLNTWYHLTFIYKPGHCLIYVNGELYEDYSTTIVPNFAGITHIGIGRGGNTTSYQTNCLMNDFRIYDHALSAKEVKELSKGLVLHYKLDGNIDGNENLFRGSAMTSTDRSGFASNASTDWTKYLRYYNGSTSIHSFSEENGVGQDTITLNSGGNLGICFARSTEEIDLDPDSYYTISCWAKSTQTAKPLCIGLSYYNDANTWVWRGGSNPKAFSAANTWQKFTLTFKPDANTQYICYCFTVVGVANGTDTFTIKECKLEKGETATSWKTSPLDNISLGTKNDIEYDCSGYGHNGTISGTLTNTSDTPRYNSSAHIGATSTKIHASGLTTAGFGNSYSFAWWGKRTSNAPMFWGFSDGIRLNGMYLGNLWNTGDGSNNPLYNVGTTTQVTAPSVNTWHHYVMTGNGTKCYVYLDGVLWAEAKTYKAISGTSLYINGWDGGTSYCSDNTDISDFRIYATALSADDIKELYHTAASVDNKGNIYAYELEEV